MTESLTPPKDQEDSYPETCAGFIALIDAAFGPDLVARVAATGHVTDEEIAAEIVVRNAKHEGWLRQQVRG